MMNALGIDHGDKRMGIAGGDALGMMAHPLEMILGAISYQPRPGVLSGRQRRRRVDARGEAAVRARPAQAVDLAAQLLHPSPL